MSITTWPWSRGEEQDKIVLYEQFLNYKLGLSEDGISDSTVCQYLKVSILQLCHSLHAKRTM